MKKKILVSMLLCLSLVLFLSFGMKREETVLFQNKNDLSNVTFAYVIDGVKQTKAPEKNTGYTFDTEKSSCTNGVSISWNYSNWNAKISNLRNTKSNCTLYFKKEYAEGILNGAVPEIKGDLVPVTIENNGVVRKADLSSSWYSYQNKQWANAVILIDKTKEYKDNEEIKEENIESYFVWIPRYRYQLKESESEYNKYTGISESLIDQKDNSQVPNKASPFEIVFENKNTPRITDNTINGWLSHPAFESFNSNGMWVGKFETGYNQNVDTNNLIVDKSSWSTVGAQQNVKDSSRVIIKPNAYSWRGIQIANAFYTSYEYERELESHMMKNMEWGAVAYLTYSEYGRCDNKNCSEVRINNSSTFITGSSANFEPSCGHTGTKETCNWWENTLLNKDGNYVWSYYNPSSQVASTTGNYYGIYDMSGSAWEYVMGVLASSDDSKTPTTGINSENNSGFNGPYANESGNKTDGLAWPSSKYYDLYDYNTSDQHYERGHLGDATKEFGPFYSIKYLTSSGVGPQHNVGSYNAGYATFVVSYGSWFQRGGYFDRGSGSGLSSFSKMSGFKANADSFRIILSPS